MTDKKLCPMTMNSSYGYSHECQEDECAWWIDGSGRCAIAKLAVELDSLADVLYEETISVKVK